MSRRFLKASINVSVLILVVTFFVFIPREHRNDRSSSHGEREEQVVKYWRQTSQMYPTSGILKDTIKLTAIQAVKQRNKASSRLSVTEFRVLEDEDIHRKYGGETKTAREVESPLELEKTANQQFALPDDAIISIEAIVWSVPQLTNKQINYELSVYTPDMEPVDDFCFLKVEKDSLQPRDLNLGAGWKLSKSPVVGLIMTTTSNKKLTATDFRIYNQSTGDEVSQSPDFSWKRLGPNRYYLYHTVSIRREIALDYKIILQRHEDDGSLFNLKEGTVFSRDGLHTKEVVITGGYAQSTSNENDLYGSSVLASTPLHRDRPIAPLGWIHTGYSPLPRFFRIESSLNQFSVLILAAGAEIEGPWLIELYDNNLRLQDQIVMRDWTLLHHLVAAGPPEALDHIKISKLSRRYMVSSSLPAPPEGTITRFPPFPLSLFHSERKK